MEKRFLLLQDTNVFKGLAIMLMLWHHLFYIDNGLYEDFVISQNFKIILHTGQFAKLCVCIFVFFSGYGLAAQAENKNGIGNVWKFYKHRFAKLYLNYWFVWIIFVPIGIFVFHRTLADAYGTEDITPRLLRDIMGIIGAHGYNPTWWFYSCIILLYLMFPLLYRLVKNNIILGLLLCSIIYFSPVYSPANSYIFSFLTGIAYPVFRQRVAPPSKKRYTLNVLLWFTLLLILCLERDIVGGAIDPAITVALVELYNRIRLPRLLKKALAILGQHSMNIFLFHTFIYYFWFQDFIYSPRTPLLIFLLLMGICLMVSVCLERLKRALRLQELINYIDKL